MYKKHYYGIYKKEIKSILLKRDTATRKINYHKYKIEKLQQKIIDLEQEAKEFELLAKNNNLNNI